MIDFYLIDKYGVSSYSYALSNAGYTFSLINNMVIAILLAGAIMLVWTLLCVFENRCSKNQSSEGLKRRKVSQEERT